VDEVKSAVDKASKQVMEDLAGLERVLAVSYPMMDYVVARTTGGNDQQSNKNPSAAAYEFLTTVVWNEDDRRHELLQVANAAFGPAGVMAGAASFEKMDAAKPRDSRTDGQDGRTAALGSRVTTTGTPPTPVAATTT